MTTTQLCDTLNAHLQAVEIAPDEYNFSSVDPIDVPRDYRWLVAFAVRGSSEGYYVHVGAITHIGDSVTHDRMYVDFGFCKTYAPDNARLIASRAQEFLDVLAWG